MNRKLPEFSTLVITGGSSGIGLGILETFLREYPRAQAISLSRNAPKLQKDQERVHHITADLADPRSRTDAIQQLLDHLEAHTHGPILLVNNSGIGTHEPVQTSDRKIQLKTIDLNISGTVHLSTTLLPTLLERGGWLTTTCSTSAFQPIPEMTTYGATKCFLLHWTLALGNELRGSKVRTLALCPGLTETPFIPQAGFEKPVRAPWGVQTVNEVVQSFYHGLSHGRSMVISGRRNWVVAQISSIAPLWLSTRVAGWLMRYAKA